MLQSTDYKKIFLFDYQFMMIKQHTDHNQPLDAI